MKRILSLLMIVLLALSLAACDLLSSEPSTTTAPTTTVKPSGTLPPADVDVYGRMNEMLGAEYSALSASVTTEKGELRLVSTYTLTELSGGARKIAFREERFAAFTEVNGAWVIPENQIAVNEGSLTFQNGAVTGRAGDDPLQAIEAAEFPRFDMAASHFTAVSESEGEFRATVRDPEIFLGRAAEVTDMTVTVRYAAGRIQTLRYAYTNGDGVLVTVVYTYS